VNLKSRHEIWTPEWKAEQLQKLKREWANCEKCGLHKTRKKTVFGVGDPCAEIMFVGEAPGELEDEKGEPFVGPSGDILKSMWAALDQRWEDIYVTNLVCCRPPENRNPVNAEKDPCFLRLQEQIYLVDPLLIVAAGKQALQYLLGGRPLSIEEKHGELMSPGVEIGGVFFPNTDENKVVHRLTYPVVPIYHPAYILRKDSYDEDTDSFIKGGIADQTFEDLQNVIIRVHRIKRAYEPVQRVITRKRESNEDEKNQKNAEKHGRIKRRADR
jgi:DNA polymerase